MPINKKSDTQTSQAAETEGAVHAVGLALTTKQSLWLAAGVLFFFGVLLWFGYQDWQRQQRMQQEFEEHLRNVPTSSIEEETKARGFFFPQNA